jgi:SAM-dependent methyltransferase
MTKACNVPTAKPARVPLRSRLSGEAANPHGRLGRFLARIWWYETAAVNVRALDLLAPRAGEHILEIGFGPGRTLHRLATIGCQVTGLDASADMVRLAGKRNAKHISDGVVELRLGSAESLPIPTSTIDAALAVHTLYFWPDLVGACAELARVLRLGGRLVLVTHDADQPHPRRFDPKIYRLRSAEQLTKTLSEAGFTSVTARHEASLLFVHAIR